MKFRYLLLASTVLLAGCDSDPASPDTIGVSGTVSFTYSGGNATSATTFSASGAVPATLAGGTLTGFGTTAWAAGGVDNTNNSLDVIASMPRSGSTWDLVVITLNRKSVGSSAIGSGCTSTSAQCTSVEVFFGTSADRAESAIVCTLASGTVTITAIDASTATGTFSGTGICTTASGGNESIFTVANGTFNVGLLATVPGDID